MRQLRQTIFGAVLILSGSIGIALGNLEKTVYQNGAEPYANFVQSPAYYMFWAYLFLGLVTMIISFMKSKKKTR